MKKLGDYRDMEERIRQLGENPGILELIQDTWY